MHQADKSILLLKKFLQTEPKEKLQALFDKIDAMPSIGPTVNEYIESLSTQMNNGLKQKL